MLMNARRGIAVAGSHGKSTTSGMIVAALRALGADPNFAIGAVLGSAGTNAAPGAGTEMVVEAESGKARWSFPATTPVVPGSRRDQTGFLRRGW
jgi:UDP-N-acetylmuramate--alanine ligase